MRTQRSGAAEGSAEERSTAWSQEMRFSNATDRDEIPLRAMGAAGVIREGARYSALGEGVANEANAARKDGGMSHWEGFGGQTPSGERARPGWDENVMLWHAQEKSTAGVSCAKADAESGRDMRDGWGAEERHTRGGPAGKRRWRGSFEERKERVFFGIGRRIIVSESHVCRDLPGIFHDTFENHCINIYF